MNKKKVRHIIKESSRLLEAESSSEDLITIRNGRFEVSVPRTVLQGFANWVEEVFDLEETKE